MVIPFNCLKIFKQFVFVSVPYFSGFMVIQGKNTSLDFKLEIVSVPYFSGFMVILADLRLGTIGSEQFQSPIFRGLW